MPSRVISTVESHTAGGPFRIVTSGLPRIKGKTIVAKRQWLKENYDEIRKSLVFEPRGHADMYGCYLTEAISSNTDFGVIFFHNEGYSDHCGHGVIALASAAVNLGWVEQKSPVTKVCIDAPCGFIEAYVDWNGKKAGNVRFTNVPSFILYEDVSVVTSSFGEVKGDIVYGGAFYFYIDIQSSSFNIRVKPSEIELLKKLGSEVKVAANEKYKAVHPFIPEINHIYGTIINDKQDSSCTQSNVCIFADRQVDRSPCGSGTAGRVAQLFLKGKLQHGEDLHNVSIIGSVFKGRIIDTAKLGEFDAAIPEVEGQSSILGFANWILDEEDVFGKGFLVRD